jgi:hypothetical protein
MEKPNWSPAAAPLVVSFLISPQKLLPPWIQLGNVTVRNRADQGLMDGFDSFVENRIQAQMSTEHLTHEERSTIASLRLKNRSITEIATIIDRHRTTVWRELKLNSNPSGIYTACRASRIAPERWGYVEEKLRDVQWSPEEIRNRMRLEGLDPIEPRVHLPSSLGGQESGRKSPHASAPQDPQLPQARLAP